MDPGVPRAIYKAFETLYNICYGAAVSGFVVIVFEFFTAIFTLLHLEIIPLLAFAVLATGEFSVCIFIKMVLDKSSEDIQNLECVLNLNL